MWLTPDGWMPEKTRLRRSVTVSITPWACYGRGVRQAFAEMDAPKADYMVTDPEFICTAMRCDDWEPGYPGERFSLGMELAACCRD